eukprot:17133-Rhodomonas_salina.2
MTRTRMGWSDFNFNSGLVTQATINIIITRHKPEICFWAARAREERTQAGIAERLTAHTLGACRSDGQPLNPDGES